MGYGYGWPYGGMGGYGGYNCRFCNPYMGCPMYCYNGGMYGGMYGGMNGGMYGGMYGYGGYPYARSFAADQYYPGYGYRPNAGDCMCDPYYGCQCNDYPYGGVTVLDKAEDKYGYNNYPG